MDMKQVNAYLRSRGIPKQTIEMIRLCMTSDALQNARDLQCDRLYTAIALTLRRQLGFGAERIVRFMHAFDELASSISDDETDWTEVTKELCDEVNIEFRTNDNNIVMDFRAKHEKDEEGNIIND